MLPKGDPMDKLKLWFWPGLLALLLISAWGVTLSGGNRGVVAWILVTQLLSLVGFVGVLIALYKLIRQRRAVTRPALVGGALSLVAFWPLLMPFGVLAIAYPAALERTQPAATVRLPSDLPLRVVWGGHRLSTNRHAATPVLAPVAATVHQALDGEPDIAIGATLADPSRLLGNHAILKLETGTYLVIAHMKQGSVRVKTGDAVAEGQQLGECGNSGNTSEPHIHIHHQRRDPLSINGDLNLGVNLVEGLPLYFRDHDGKPMPEGGIRVVGGTLELIGDVVTHRPR